MPTPSYNFGLSAVLRRIRKRAESAREGGRSDPIGQFHQKLSRGFSSGSIVDWIMRLDVAMATAAEPLVRCGYAVISGTGLTGVSRTKEGSEDGLRGKLPTRRRDEIREQHELLL